MPQFWTKSSIELLLLTGLPGGDQDHRQDAAGSGQFGQSVSGGSHHEDAQPPTHRQVIPGQWPPCTRTSIAVFFGF